MIRPGIEPVVEELLAVLDEEMDLLDLKRSQLAQLSEALLRSDNQAVEDLLVRIEQAQKVQVTLDLRLKGLRETFAAALGCSERELNLSRLVAELPQEQAAAVTGRRRQVARKVEQFRRQHMQTTILLAECSRITGMLLDSLLPAGEAVVTYGAGGADHWRAGGGLLDMEQ